MSKATAAKKNVNANPIGATITFSGKEAYKLLRTNLMFSLPRNDQKARVVGVTSSVSGEGKSITSVNMAYSLAEAGVSVLLIECDLRIPTLGKKLGLMAGVGLSNLLARVSLTEDILHKNVLIKGMNVILAGDVPPNPAELLGSQAMKIVIEKMSAYYDYIILDLPPVCSVTDALVVSKFLEGIIVVVRQDFTSSVALINTIRQLKHVNAHILGFVYNDASSRIKKYRSKMK